MTTSTKSLMTKFFGDVSFRSFVRMLIMKDRKVSSFEQTLYETILVMTVIDVIMCPKKYDPEIAPKKSIKFIKKKCKLYKL